jgi:hypothetical protein
MAKTYGDFGMEPNLFLVLLLGLDSFTAPTPEREMTTALTFIII